MVDPIEQAVYEYSDDSWAGPFDSLMDKYAGSKIESSFWAASPFQHCLEGSGWRLHSRFKVDLYFGDGDSSDPTLEDLEKDFFERRYGEIRFERTHDSEGKLLPLNYVAVYVRRGC
ncbi:MAG: hypothetical protein Q8P81_04230 [Nanoarchaeota archaeon]|nr:hypothetical protein [Nanoarchaeota archaeon]